MDSSLLAHAQAPAVHDALATQSHTPTALEAPEQHAQARAQAPSPAQPAMLAVAAAAGALIMIASLVACNAMWAPPVPLGRALRSDVLGVAYHLRLWPA
jgi:hypothetical protein